MNGTDDRGNCDSPADWPNAAQLQRDIRHFERQIARLATPNSTWEQGALKCYQVLVAQRRKILEDLRSGEAASIQ